MPGIILHSLFKNDCRCHASYSFDKRVQDRMTIATVMTIISSISLLLALIPAIIMSNPIGFIWAGIFGSMALALFVFAILTNYLRSNIPKGLKETFKDKYPPIFCDFIEKKQLTIQEIRLLLDALEQASLDRDMSFHKYLGKFTQKLKIALNKYGISEFVDGLEQIDLASLDLVLIQHCPLYWLRKFIQSASEVPERDLTGASYEEIASYWLGKSGCCNNAGTIFSENVYLLAQTVSKEDYEKFSFYVQNNDWNNQELATEKQRVVEDCLELKREHNENAVVDVTSFLSGIKNTLLEICTHGICWEQLNLVRCVNPDDWDCLCALDGNKQRIRKFAVPCLGEVSDEKHHLYEPMIALITWQDIRELGLDKETLLNQEVRNPEDRLANYFTRQARYHGSIDLLGQEVLERLPRYTLDFATGAKTTIS
ncbi:DUF1389 domain-containing protein [Chlamydia buteonis]|uniref:DUF1389 domain-containing protein n=1 Tax=Chlamydia buteonis TaxID=2494525 RepID=A0ABX8LBC2_9CHLA|nr:DUF1389 domain-containing protein [Chlamydia buteonis]QXE27067.1 DUF1389 domain-containing protein [Chlamydia buteonis]QXE27998.1 DUF1389 domain-containing protein [Chlamydia buteonis]